MLDSKIRAQCKLLDNTAIKELKTQAINHRNK